MQTNDPLALESILGLNSEYMECAYSQDSIRLQRHFHKNTRLKGIMECKKKSKHYSEKDKFECDECGKTCTSKTSLKVHIMSHSDSNTCLLYTSRCV